MAMLEKHRNTIYNYFRPLLGEEATQAMLTNHPARDVEEPVTREHLALSMAELRAEIQDVRAEIQDVRAEIQDVRLSVEQLRTEMQRQFNRLLIVLVTVVSIAVGVILRAG